MNYKKIGVMPYLIIACVSYTCLTVTMSLMCILETKILGTSELSMNISEYIVLELFVSTATIGLLMYIQDRLLDTGLWVQMGIQITIVSITVFSLGYLFHWFPTPFETKHVIFVMVEILLVYFVTYAIMMLQNKRTSDKINKIIKEKRRASK